MYKAFPILNMREGKRLDLNPWLLPQDAFENLRNCHLRDGVLEKRRGYSLFGQIVKVATTTKVPTLSTNPVTGIFNHLSGTTENLLAGDKERVCKFISNRVSNVDITGAFADAGGGNVTVTAAGHGLEDDDIVTISGTTNYNDTFNVQNKTTNDFEITETFNAEAAAGTITQEAFLDLTKNKINFNSTNQNFTPSAGDTIRGGSSNATATISTSGVLVNFGAFDNNDAFGTLIFDNASVTGTFTTGEDLQEDGTPANILGQAIGANSDEAFTGDSTDFFFTENWDHDGSSDFLYITNGQDPVQIYDGNHLRILPVDITTNALRTGVNNLNSCLLVVIFKERVILFNTNENGKDFFQRARWSGIKEPFSWPTAGFKDAPTSDIITSVDFIGEELYVWFERSVFRFTWTGDSSNPFEWERVDNVNGTVAKMSLVTQDDRQYALGTARINVFNGRDVVSGSRKIPDFTLDWNQDSLPFSNSVLLDEERQIHLSYTSDAALSDDSDQPNDGNTYPDSVLVLNYEDFGYATYGLPVHSFGFSSVESDLTWDDISAAWEDIDFSWNAGQAKSGFPTTIFGNHLGKIFQMNFGGSDDGSNIEFRAVGGQWNPFVDIGHKAKLGYIDFLVDVDASVTFDVKSFLNTDGTEFQTKTVTCNALEGSDSIVWKRVDVFATADFHRIEITNNATVNRPRIHAIVPYFEDVGGRLV